MPFRITTAAIAGLFCTVLGVWSIAKNPRGKTHQSFLFFNLTLAVWNFDELIVYIGDHNRALFLYRLCYVAGSFIAFSFLKFMFSVIKREMSWTYTVIKWSAVTFALFSITRFLISDIQYDFRQSSPITEIHGPLYLVFIFYFVSTLAYSLFALIHTYRRSLGANKNQLRYVATAICVGIVALVIYFGNQVNEKIPPIHYIVEMGIGSIFAYAIVKHRLMDTQLLSRNATGWLFSGVPSLLPFIGAVCLARFLWGMPHFFSSSSAGTLICSILDFSLALTTIRVVQNPHARRLCRLFIFLGIWNLSELVLDIPSGKFSVVAYRFSYAVSCLVVLSWFYFWRSYFDGENPRLKRIAPWFVNSAWVLLILGGFTPFVLKSLVFDVTGGTPAVEVPGPAHLIFSILFLVIGAGALFWPITAREECHEAKKNQMIFWIAGSFVFAALASLGYFLFVQNLVSWYWYPPLQFILRFFLMGALVCRIPEESGHTPRIMARQLGSFAIAVLLISLFSGFLLAQKSWVMAVGGFLGGSFIVLLTGMIHQPIQEWVDQTFVFRKEFGHLVKAKEVVQKEWNLDSLEDALPLVAQEVLKTTPYRACTIAIMFDDQPKRPFFRSTQLRLAQGELIQGVQWPEPLVMAFLQLIRRDGGLCLREEVNDIPLLIQELDPLLFEAAVPLKTDGKIVGVVVMGPKEGKGALFHNEDINILMTLANTLSQRLGPSVGLNLFRCIVNNTLHDVLGHDIGPMVDQMAMGYSLTPDMTLRGLRKIRDELKGLRGVAQGELEKGRIKEPDPLDMEGLLKGIYALHKSAAEKKGLQIELIISPHLPKPRLDPLLVERCIGNLVTNAIKYTLHGSVELSVQQEGKYIAVCVADTGIGIPDDFQGRIFEAGFRVPGLASTLAEGTGIGLTNVQDIMVAIGGRVRVDSEHGRGSRFYLYLPLPASITDVKALI